MCGISGVIALDGRRDVTSDIERLTTALAHRGPDSAGIRFVRGRSAALGHRRLSIVDVEGGLQPMSNEDGRIWVVFNGELYNHRELRAELLTEGHRFQTRSDTEVLVHGWEQWGPRLLERLNGIYAFGLFDDRDGRGELWLARDPVGVKPLYLGRNEHAWWFASELGAARQAGLQDPTLRPEAIDEYLVYRFVPSPGTPYRGAWKMPPGHLCRLALAHLPTRPHLRRFETTFAPAVLPRTAGEWEEAVRSGLRDAVRRQLMSDVPVGSLLSGGVDSTVVTALMRAALGAPPQAFAVGFSDSRDGGELPAARRAARALDVPLTELSLVEQQFMSTWPDYIATLGEPVANSGVPLLALLCRRVRETHKVVLTGQGADEPLGGYARHTMERVTPLLQLLRPALAHLPEALASSDRVERVRRIATAADDARRFAETLAVFGPGEAISLTRHALDADALVEPVRRWLGRGRHDGSFNQLLQVDTRLSLADDLLTVADHVSMASSVELRVPFLDLQFLALVERMPARYKVSLLGERKWLYRRAVTPLLPAALRSELTGLRARVGRKLGFSTPMERWYPGWLTREAQSFLTGPGARLPHFVDGGRLAQYVQRVRDERQPRARQMIALYVLEVWLRGATAIYDLDRTANRRRARARA